MKGNAEVFGLSETQSGGVPCPWEVDGGESHFSLASHGRAIRRSPLLGGGSGLHFSSVRCWAFEVRCSMFAVRCDNGESMGSQWVGRGTLFIGLAWAGDLEVTCLWEDALKGWATNVYVQACIGLMNIDWGLLIVDLL